MTALSLELQRALERRLLTRPFDLHRCPRQGLVELGPRVGEPALQVLALDLPVVQGLLELALAGCRLGLGGRQPAALVLKRISCGLCPGVRLLP